MFGPVLSLALLFGYSTPVFLRRLLSSLLLAIWYMRSWHSLGCKGSCEPELANQNILFPRSWWLAEEWAFDLAKRVTYSEMFAETAQREVQVFILSRWILTWEDGDINVAADNSNGELKMESTERRTEPRDEEPMHLAGLIWISRFNSAWS